MKNRLGFVSNSSSSSFVLITTKENYDTVLKESHPFVKKVMNKIGLTNNKFLGKDVVVLEEWSTQGYSSVEDLDDSWDDEYPEDINDGYEAFCHFKDALKKNGECLTHNMDM